MATLKKETYNLIKIASDNIKFKVMYFLTDFEITKEIIALFKESIKF